MKYYILLLTFIVSSMTINAQSKDTEVKIGAIYTIGKSATKDYSYINFPKANIIAKRGGIANYNSLQGQEVIITSTALNKDGNTIVTFKRNDGKRFFGSHNYITANYNKAIEAKELQAK